MIELGLEQVLLIIEKELKVDYRVVNPNNKINVIPASIKKCIPFGLYYLTKDFLGELSKISNSIIITDFECLTENTLIVVDNPQLIHYKVLNDLLGNKAPTIHLSAIIHTEAKIGKNVNIGPYCVIGKCVIENNVQLQNHVVVKDDVVLKRNTYIDSHSCIGASGIAWIWDDNGNRVLQPQTGGVIIEEDCYLGTDVTVVRGSLSEDTIIGRGTVIAHGTKIGHGVKVGAFVHMANNVSLAGNANIGERTFLGSACVVSSNVNTPNNTIVGAGAVVNKSIDEEYCTLVGVPAKVITKNNYLNKPKGVPKPFKK